MLISYQLYIQMIKIIVAISIDGKITDGTDDLSWKHKNDFSIFKRITKEIGTVVMGRKTFETLPKGHLKKRDNIVMTKKLVENERVVGGDQVVFTSKTPKEIIKEFGNNLAIIGGAEIYNLWLPYVDEVILVQQPIWIGREGLELFRGKHTFSLFKTEEQSGLAVLTYKQ